MALYGNNLAVLMNTAGERVMTRSEMEEVCKEFYTDLFASKAPVEEPALHAQKEESFR